MTVMGRRSYDTTTVYIEDHFASPGRGTRKKEYRITGAKSDRALLSKKQACTPILKRRLFVRRSPFLD